MMTPISKVIFAMIAILSVVSAALVGVSALDYVMTAELASTIVEIDGAIIATPTTNIATTTVHATNLVGVRIIGNKGPDICECPAMPTTSKGIDSTTVEIIESVPATDTPTIVTPNSLVTEGIDSTIWSTKTSTATATNTSPGSAKTSTVPTSTVPTSTVPTSTSGAPTDVPIGASGGQLGKDALLVAVLTTIFGQLIISFT